MFDPTDRAFFAELQAIVIDDQGREVLAGLTYDETAEYLRLAHNMEHRSPDEDGRFKELHDKHEQTRLKMLGSGWGRPH